MKVGIDGVLLGAWARMDAERHILDVGTGTGLLALMAAQRTAAFVDAVEIEADAAHEARDNFNQSLWTERLRLFVTAFQDFDADKKYDHIIANPPFFDHQKTPKSGDAKRATARHADCLSIEELLAKAVALLSDSGRISLILPADQEERLRAAARHVKLYVNRCAKVFPDETRPAHRILVELSAESGLAFLESIYIRKRETGDYTEQYRQLTSDFYLAF
ncbi:tRNA1Val (adenine37-N6)-methyltransferase [Mangrovibacterium marinum]|uniref:tRNA1(Val) (adenine(37)-N6)-methyltransferase n=2 Tax=Mangrovibacterium marinum TaxID=1639118 RepID=A0A2T5C204_9BACT|nr:tRNA1Val (adenine37-N6)-methyltransferase [Mangrovibacterium marinum]